jgi:RNA polymerase sigma-70 factor, ECF subfamily
VHQLEKNILEQIRKGDTKAFESLFKSYFGQLLNYAKEILKDHDLAEEMAEEAFVKFWENREKINIDTSIRAYLFRSVFNQCLNHFKHMKVRDKYKLFFLHHICPEEMYATYSFDFPLSGIFEKELEHLVEKSIAKLPNQCREIFIMSRYEDMQNDLIAKKLGISVSTVKTQISRALVKLRKDLHEVLPFL